MSEFVWVEGIGLDVIQASKREPRIMQYELPIRQQGAWANIPPKRSCKDPICAKWAAGRTDSIKSRHALG
jgi:hypothetical protein